MPALLLFLLLCASCNTKGNWKTDAVRGDSGTISSSRLLYKSPISMQGMGFEVFRMGEENKGYLCLLSPYRNTTNELTISFYTDSAESFQCTALLHEGGERVLLPEETTKKVLLSLQEGKSITLDVLGRTSILEPQGFSSCYKEFQKNSSLEMPWTPL